MKLSGVPRFSPTTTTDSLVQQESANVKRCLGKLLLILTKYNKPLHYNTEAYTGEVLNKILHFIIAYDFQGYMDEMPAR